jgi:hypothetical protein
MINSYEKNSDTEGTYTVHFFPNITVDNTSHLAGAPGLLQLTFQLVEESVHGIIEFWRLINWSFMSDISPTIYPQVNMPIFI